MGFSEELRKFSLQLRDYDDMEERTSKYCSTCPYKVGEFELNLHQKFIHGNIYLEAQANYLRINKNTVILNESNNFYDEVEVHSNNSWIIV